MPLRSSRVRPVGQALLSVFGPPGGNPSAGINACSLIRPLVLSLLGGILVAPAMPLAARGVHSTTLAAERQVTVAPNVALRIVEAGDRTASSTIIFIPGWSAGADIWSDQAKRFKSANRVISFDPRSQGESTKTVTGNTPEQRAADLQVLLTKEGVHGAVLVGWSQAAQDIAAYVQRFGTGDIRGIVLVDAAISDGANAIAERPAEVAVQFRVFSTYLSSQKAYLRGMFGAIVSKQQPPGVIDRAVATAMKTPSSIGMSMLVADMFTVDRTDALSKITCPVLIIAAGSSRELERQKAEVHAIKNGRFVEIDNSAHAVFLDQPDRFATALTQFVQTLPTR